MEDASIHINNFPMANHYLFAIFDGHGGTSLCTQVHKSHSTVKSTFPPNSTSTTNSSTNSTKPLSAKPSTKWTTSSKQKSDADKSRHLSIKTSATTTAAIRSTISTLDARLMCVSSPKRRYSWPMLEIRGAWPVLTVKLCH